jgi:hypothetical protein
MVLLASVYGGLVYYFHSLTGTPLLDGGLGVVIGLYIASHPAANAVDMIFAERGAFRHMATDPSGYGWLGLNLLVMLAGWTVIVIGAMQLFK